MKSPSHVRWLAPLVVGSLLASACDGEVTHEELTDSVSYVNEGAGLWEDLSLDPAGEGVISPMIVPPQEDFDRVGFRFDALGEEVLSVDVRVTDDGGATWSAWIPGEITYRDEVAHNGHADVPHPGTHVQLRIQTNHPQGVSFLAVEVFRFAAEHELEGAVDDDGIGTDQQELATGSAVDVRRGGWNARATKCSVRMSSAHRMAVHHTATPTNDSLSPPARMRQMQRFHMDTRGFCDIGYHFVIGQDGRVYEGRSERLQGAHARGANSGNIGISFMGTYGSRVPSDRMLAAAARILRAASDKHGISLDRNRVKGHREWQSGTTCPGAALLGDLGSLLSRARGGSSTPPPPPPSTSRFTLPVPQGGVVLTDNERHFHACRGGDGQSNSACTRLHLGVDIHAQIGVPIVAAADGVVVARSTNSGAGLYLNVQHADGYVTRYLHLDRTRNVSVGTTVTRGQWIADVGETGRAGSGPHLHFEIRRNGSPIDPAPHIGWHDLPRVDTAPRGRVSGSVGGGGGGGGTVGGGSGGNVLLNPGDRGVDVYRLQHLLEAWRPGIMGGTLGSRDTATYGPATLAAVHVAARELRGHQNPSADYTVGPLFWGALVDAVHDRYKGSRRIRYLDTGPDVYRLQHALEAWKPGIMGGTLGAVQTARYGPATREAVHAAARELRGHANPSPEYTVGPLFWEALLGAIGTSDTITGGSFMLNPGDSGTDVYRLQHLLEAWSPGVMGGSLGGQHTATYGARTLDAVHAAARALRGHANPSADYTVGPKFWEAVTGAIEARFSGTIRIRYGDSGPDVYRLQHALEAWRPGILGGSLGAIQTATYGPRTLEAVHAAAKQLRGHANPSDDYTVGPLFWAALLTAIEQHR